jgi:exonuclease III
MPPLEQVQGVARTPCKRSSGPDGQSQAPRANKDCNITEDGEEEVYFGDAMGRADGEHIRIGSINLNNTLQNEEGDERLFREIQARDIQILCMQEVGCNWKNMGRTQRFQHRINQTFGPHETRSTFQHNVHDLTGSKRQWGGTGILSKGKIKHYTKETGGDPTGLGRWTWVRLHGKDGMILRYVSIYCPCESKTGMLTVWTQHKTL